MANDRPSVGMAVYDGKSSERDPVEASGAGRAEAGGRMGGEPVENPEQCVSVRHFRARCAAAAQACGWEYEPPSWA